MTTDTEGLDGNVEVIDTEEAREEDVARQRQSRQEERTTEIGRHEKQHKQHYLKQQKETVHLLQ